MWFVFLPVAPLSSAAAVIPGLAAVTITLALLSSVLLSHLLCFHIYLSKRQHTHLSISLPICVLACLSVFTRLFVLTEFERCEPVCLCVYLSVCCGPVSHVQCGIDSVRMSTL